MGLGWKESMMEKDSRSIEYPSSALVAVHRPANGPGRKPDWDGPDWAWREQWTIYKRELCRAGSV